MLRLEPRPQPSAALAALAPVAALVLTVLLGAALFAALGRDPLDALRLFFLEPLRSGYALSELAVKAVPLALIALGLAVCFRANVWNIGAEGQFVAGAVCAGGVALQAGPATGGWIVLPILLAAILGGMLWAALVALLRDRFGASEILVSLMLVYVAIQGLDWLVHGPWKDPQGYNFPQTAGFAPGTRIPRLVAGWRLDLGAPLAVAAATAVWLLMSRSFAGFRLQVGGLAGLAGGLEAAGPLGQLTPHLPVGYGFAAIIVAFVGRLHPFGVVAAALLMSLLYIGGELAQSRIGLPKSLTGVFQGLLLFALLACDTLLQYRVRRARPGAA